MANGASTDANIERAVDGAEADPSTVEDGEVIRDADDAASEQADASAAGMIEQMAGKIATLASLLQSKEQAEALEEAAEPPESGPVSATPIGGSMDRYCQNCGAAQDHDGGFCPECGTELVRSAPAKSDDPTLDVRRAVYGKGEPKEPKLGDPGEGMDKGPGEPKLGDPGEGMDAGTGNPDPDGDGDGDGDGGGDEGTGPENAEKEPTGAEPMDHHREEVKRLSGALDKLIDIVQNVAGRVVALEDSTEEVQRSASPAQAVMGDLIERVAHLESFEDTSHRPMARHVPVEKAFGLEDGGTVTRDGVEHGFESLRKAARTPEDRQKVNALEAMWAIRDAHAHPSFGGPGMGN